MALIDSLEKSITALAQKATQGMQSLLSKGLAKPVDSSGIISKCGLTVVRKSNTSIQISTDFPDYAYYVKYGRNPGKMPPEKPIKDWIVKHNISPAAVFPIRRKIADKGTKGVDFTTPLYRMIEMIKKTVGIDSVNIIEDSVYKDVKTLQDINVKL